MKQALALTIGVLLLNGCVSSLPRLPDLAQELFLNNQITTKQIVIGAIVLAWLTDWDGPRRDEDSALRSAARVSAMECDPFSRTGWKTLGQRRSLVRSNV